jgi:muconate cycloisomerase
MKPARVGGLVAARRQIEMTLDAGLLWLGSGLTDPDVSLAAALALFSSYGQQKPCALNGPQFLAHSVLAEPLAPANGKLAAPSGPGLGIMVDDSRRRAIAVSHAPGASSGRDQHP